MNLNYLYHILSKIHIKCDQLKSMGVINKYNIELKKENERLCLDDSVTEFDVKINIKLEPKKSIGYIENKITITKSGSFIDDDKLLPEKKLNKMLELIKNLLYPAKIIEQDYIKNVDLISYFIQRINTNRPKTIICNGKISNLLEKENDFKSIKSEIDYKNWDNNNINEHFFISGTFLDVNITIPMFMRWDDNRVFFINENDDIFILNILYT